MMTMSKALSAGQAKEYYRQEYTNTSESYYSETGEVRGRWSGRLAEEWGLRGDVQSEQYERLCAGQDPRTGEQLVRAVKSSESVNRYGEGITTSEHRAGWDATFSAPKSVSLAALVGDDKRIREAHRESVDEALKALEEYTQARGGGNKPAITTGKMIAAQFEHTAARPDRTTGYAAPQLHTHVVIFNMTETAEGKSRSVQPLELYRSQQYATAVYRMNLAERLQALGYETEVDGRTGAPEIKGFSQEYLRESSPRREELRKEAQQMKERLEREGVTVKEGAGLNQAAARTDRAGKRYDRAEMRGRALAMDAQYDHQARHAVEQARTRGPFRLTQEEIARRAQEAVTFARDNAMEREAVAEMRKVTVNALRRNMALTTYEAIKAELAERVVRGEFIGITRDHQPRETTTRHMLEMEQSNIQRMLNGQGRHEPIISADNARQIIESLSERQALEFRHLDHGYAVTSYSSQGQTVGRAIINADTRESELLLNQRMGYVALSRATDDATIYTNSKEELGEALDRRVDKEMALEATGQKYGLGFAQGDRDGAERSIRQTQATKEQSLDKGMGAHELKGGTAEQIKAGEQAESMAVEQSIDLGII